MILLTFIDNWYGQASIICSFGPLFLRLDCREKEGSYLIWVSIPLELNSSMISSRLAVITSPDLHKHGEIWVVPNTDHVCTRFFFV